MTSIGPQNVPGEYEVLSQSHVTRFIPETGNAVRGWWVSFRDRRTGVHDQVWIPDSAYPNAVPTAIMAALSDIRYVHSLNGTGE